MIEKKELSKLAELARVTLSDDEEVSFRLDVEAILGYVKDIENAGIKDIKPSVGRAYNVLREDSDPHESGIFTEELLNAAPQRKGDYIKVKRILAQ